MRCGDMRVKSLLCSGGEDRKVKLLQCAALNRAPFFV